MTKNCPFEFRSTGNKYFANITQPMQLTSITFRIISTLLTSLKKECAPMPAAKTTMSTFPNFASVKSTSALQSYSFVASATLQYTFLFPYCSQHSATSSYSLVSWRPETTKGHCRWAYLRAISRPRPLEAPCTRTTLPGTNWFLLNTLYTL